MFEIAGETISVASALLCIARAAEDNWGELWNILAIKVDDIHYAHDSWLFLFFLSLLDFLYIFLPMVLTKLCCGFLKFWVFQFLFENFKFTIVPYVVPNGDTPNLLHHWGALTLFPKLRFPKHYFYKLQLKFIKLLNYLLNCPFGIFENWNFNGILDLFVNMGPNWNENFKTVLLQISAKNFQTLVLNFPPNGPHKTMLEIF